MNRTTRRTMLGKGDLIKKLSFYQLTPLVISHRLERERTKFQTSGGARGREGGFNKEMEYAKGPIFYLTAAV